jgi:hypothetical protein
MGGDLPKVQGNPQGIQNYPFNQYIIWCVTIMWTHILM